MLTLNNNNDIVVPVIGWLCCAVDKKVKFEHFILQATFTKFEYILMPHCYGVNMAAASGGTPSGEHWMLLVAEVASQKVFVLNSLQQSKRYQEAAATLCHKWW